MSDIVKSIVNSSYTVLSRVVGGVNVMGILNYILIV